MAKCIIIFDVSLLMHADAFAGLRGCCDIQTFNPFEYFCLKTNDNLLTIFEVNTGTSKVSNFQITKF